MVESKEFSGEPVAHSRAYFSSGNQTTVLALDRERRVIGCATLCYIEMMPTFSHPTGKRAHLMNVYTMPEYRRQGIAQHMLGMLIREAKEKGRFAFVRSIAYGKRDFYL